MFADYFGEVEHPYILEKEQEQIEETIIDNIEKKQIFRARVGQGEYRKNLLGQCPFCPITHLNV